MSASAAAWVSWTGLWATLGLRELVVVAFVALIMYGRAGMRHTRHARTVLSWMTVPPRVSKPGRPMARPEPEPKPKRFWAVSQWGWGERLFWSLALLATTAVAAWIVTRTLIVSAAGSAR